MQEQKLQEHTLREEAKFEKIMDMLTRIDEKIRIKLNGSYHE